MKGIVFVILITLYLAYSALVYTSGTESGLYLTEQAVEGKLLFQSYNCIACHQVYGLGGYLGPELTTVISEKGRNYAKVFIRNGTSKMPDFKLKEQEVERILEYLAWVDKSAITYKKPGLVMVLVP